VNLSDYSYVLPKELIAQAPAEPRDSSRLMIYSVRTDELVFDTFANLARYLPADSVLVLNDTKVVPARLRLNRLSGGVVHILFLFNEWNGEAAIKGLPDKEIRAGEALFLDQRPIVEAVSHVNEEFTFKLLIPAGEFEKMCVNRGETPLPPYIHSGLDEAELREKYQTLFAANPASVAAPTGSLHFTSRVFEALSEKGIARALVTLHVGRGTFSPVDDAAVQGGVLHPEPITIGQETVEIISAAKKTGKAVIAAGTTTTRLLESVADGILAGDPYHGETALFIKPPYKFKIVDGLITNFHLPGTSLLMLLDAFMRFKGAKKSWRDLYAIAIREKLRFYSFGDSMLVI